MQLARGESSVMVSWRAPSGTFDGYTVQRQELVVVEGSTLFANIVTLGGDSWLPSSSAMYTDTAILPSQTYEYRVAAVQDDQVGEYSDWFRTAPPITSLGAPPAALRLDTATDNRLDNRREFWMVWEEVPGAEDYELTLISYDASTRTPSMATQVVTDTTYFHTAYGRVVLRVRGRHMDATLCDAAPNNRCVSDWTPGWYEVKFEPKGTIQEQPPPIDGETDPSVAALRAATISLIETVLEPAGSAIDTDMVLAFMVVTGALVVGAASVVLALRKGMAALGVGMACAVCILILLSGYRLYGTPIAWPYGAQATLAVTGLFALVRQTGVFR